MDKYLVIELFEDDLDGKRLYRVGDVYPREGLVTTEARIKQLMGLNKYGKTFLQKYTVGTGVGGAPRPLNLETEMAVVRHSYDTVHDRLEADKSEMLAFFDNNVIVTDDDLKYIKPIAQNAYNQSSTALQNISELQSQVDNLVVNGDSSPAADQAKVDDKGFTHPTLKRRIDSSDLAKYRIKNGKIKLPSDFPKLPFDIFKVSDWNFTHNATPYNQHDWSTATEVFIAGLGEVVGSDGLTVDSPISLVAFADNVTAGRYPGQENFILSILNTYYSVPTVKLGALNINLYMRSMALSGKTFMTFPRLQGSGSVTEPWTLIEGAYKTKITGATSLALPVNVGSGVDEYGMSYPHREVSSIAECKSTSGSYIIDSPDNAVWVNPFPNESIYDIELFTEDNILGIFGTSDNVFIFENLHFSSGSYYFNPSTVETKLYFFNCRFYKGTNDAFSITGKFTVYLFDCVGAYPNKDAFNYHTTDKNSLAVEINAKGYGAGQYKYLAKGNQGRGSNNGSTAHDGMYMLRVGSIYWDCEGPIIADINNCYSISIGCKSFDILDSTTGIRSGMYVGNDAGVTLENEKPKYFIECEQHGKYFNKGIVAALSTKTYVQGINADTSEAIEIDWEDVV